MDALVQFVARITFSLRRDRRDPIPSVTKCLTFKPNTPITGQGQVLNDDYYEWRPGHELTESRLNTAIVMLEPPEGAGDACVRQDRSEVYPR